MTSRQVVDAVKKDYPNEKVGYVGTLDPMANGLLLIVTGKDTKRVEELVSLPKEYEFKVLFGIKTDSGDILGKNLKFKIKNLKLNITFAKLNTTIKFFRGNLVQTVPLFSSIKYKGRELHKWGREGKINDVGLLKRKVTIHEIELLNFYSLPHSAFKNMVFSKLALLDVKSGKMFRLDEVLESWQNFFKVFKSGLPYPVAKIRATVSRGTYIRSLAEDIGKRLGADSMCLSIKRTKVGSYEIGDLSKKD